MANPPREEGPGAFAIADARVSDRVQHFPESVIREMARWTNRHGAVNLSQGFPDLDPPKEILGAVLYDAPTAIGFKCARPEGSYCVMADIRPLTDKDDVGFSRFLVEEVGVAAVPGSSFLAEPAEGRSFVRFAFPKRIETLREATKRLEKVAA